MTLTDNARSVKLLNQLNYFGKRSECTSGYGYTCKECGNAVNKVLQKKREYREANKDIINQHRRENRAKKRAEKPKPDMEIGDIMLSQVPVEQLKNLAGYQLTVKMLRVIAQQHNIKLGKLTKKVDIIQHLIANDILSDVALCMEEQWEAEEELSQ